jgi:hypothetical protein
MEVGFSFVQVQFFPAPYYPGATSHVRAAAKEPLCTAANKEEQKKQKYTEAANAEGMAFRPFVLETYGAFGKEAQQIVKQAVKEMADKLPPDTLTKAGLSTWTAASFRTHYLQRISICLQKGNAKAIIKRAQRDFKMAGHHGTPLTPPRDHLAEGD